MTTSPRNSAAASPALFSILRTLTRLFASPDDRHLGLYGAFGYDLVFQFEPMALRLKRAADQRDLLLYLPDEILVVDQMKQEASLRRYEFETVTGSTEGLPRDTLPAPYQPVSVADLPESDHGPGDYPAQASVLARLLHEAICSKSCWASSSPRPASIRRAQCSPACRAAIRLPMAL
ncbi:MAG: hypothetical protein WDN69_05885 [Aliidongia sp.]